MKPFVPPAFALCMALFALAPLQASEMDSQIQAAAKLTIAEIIDDASINAQVRMALLTHRSTSAFRTLVATMNGVVMVGGFAKNTAEIDLVTKLVTDIHGVKSVVNKMVVEAGTAKK